MHGAHKKFRKVVAVLVIALGLAPETGFVSAALAIDPIALGLSGTSSCGGANQIACTTSTATKQGAWKTDQTCAEGFHDPTAYGGSCWTCPTDYIRSLTPVTDPTACWRPAHPEYAAAIRKTTGTIFPHECWATGAFWDGYDGGGCWTCPADHPARGSAAVYSSEACWVDSGHQESPANLKAVKGCPSTTPGQVYPDGRPFYDPIEGGTCWTCPAFGDRTGFAVNGNLACAIGFGWNTPKYPEPGLLGLDGGLEVFKALLARPQDITDYLYLVAKEGKVTPADRPAWVAGKWAEIAAAPQKSDALNTLANLQVIKAAAKMDSLPDTDPGKRLAAAFAQYVRDRRTFVAQDALHMYDVWKAGVEYQRNQHPPNIGDVFYIGTPPPDFLRQAQENWLQLAVGASAGLGLLGAGASAAAFSAFMPVTILGEGAEAVESAVGFSRVFFQALRAIQGGAQAAEGVFAAAGAAMAGASIIAAIGAAIGAAAIDIVVKAETARPKLVSNLDSAKGAVDIETFVDNSEAFGYYWALGTPGGSASCAAPVEAEVFNCLGYNSTVLTVTTLANTAYQTVQVTGFSPSFAQPPKITSAAAAAFPINHPSQFTVTTSGTTPAITLTGALPSGVTFTDSGNGTGKISGTPTAYGVYPVTIKAANDVGGASQSFQLAVGMPPSFTSVPAMAFVETHASTFTIRTSGDPTPEIDLFDTSILVTCDASGCSSPLTGDGNLPSGVTFNDNGDGTATISGTPARGTSPGNIISIPGLGGRLVATNAVGTAIQDFTITVAAPPLTAIAPAKVWTGLMNSDSIGLRVDLLAQAFLKVGATETKVAEGQLNNVAPGGSGFGGATLQTIPLALSGPVPVPAGAQLELKVSARRTCVGGGHAAGTVLLWYNGRAIDTGSTRDAGSRFAATIDGASLPFSLRSGSVLSGTAGTAKTSVAVTVTSKEPCTGRGYVSFGTWSAPLP